MLLISFFKVRVNFTELILPLGDIPVVAFVVFGDDVVPGVITDVFASEIVSDDDAGVVTFSKSEISKLY